MEKLNDLAKTRQECVVKQGIESRLSGIFSVFQGWHVGPTGGQSPSTTLHISVFHLCASPVPDHVTKRC